MKIRCSNCFNEYEEMLGMCPHCGYVEGENYSEVYSLTPGTKILDRYIIGETLGVGGFGITYKAWDIQLETVLAIKEYFPGGLVNRTTDSPEVFLVAAKKQKEFEYGKKRFLDEARNMAKFSKHHNIVNVFNYFEANNTAYIIMEYLDGLTLRQTLQAEKKPLTVDRCIKVAIAVCDALESIHKEGILHRDVSPDNIMICKDGTVKVFDFGAARFSMDATQDSRVTVIVKPGFAPPEQYDKINQQDARTDIYALGATLYYALTGVKPEESTDRKMEDQLQPPKELVPEIPNYVNNAVMRAMAIDMQYRFKTVEEFRKVFEQKIEVDSIEKEKARRARKKFISIGAALFVIALAFAAFFIQWNQQEVPAGSIQVWYASTGDAGKDEQLTKAWNSVIEMFMKDYDNVTVTVTGVPETVYVEKIAEAQKNGTMPELYESTLLPDSLLHDAQPLVKVMKTSQKMYQEALAGKDKQFPTGLVLPAIYVNTSLGPVREAGNIVTMEAACKDFNSTLMISKDAAELYEKVYDVDLSAYIKEDAVTQFVNGNCLMYLGTTEDYFETQNLMRNGKGRYTILFPETEKSVYTYGCLWSCDDIDSAEGKIAVAFMNYMNTNFAQDCLNIQNFAQSGCIPVTEKGMEEFLIINQELEGIKEYLKLPYAE